MQSVNYKNTACSQRLYQPVGKLPQRDDTKKVEKGAFEKQQDNTTNE